MSCDPKALGDKLNLAENMIGRAMRAAYKSNFTKAWNDTHTAMALAQEAMAMCHDEVPHEHPAPTPTPEPVPAPTPSPDPTDPHEHEPTPAPTPTGWIRADSIVPIPSAFDINQYLDPCPIAQFGGDEGAYRLTGNMSHLNYDDPIVYPDQPGKAHLHHFFGNRTTNAFSTYASLRSDPRSTTDSDMANGSAYWITALLNGQGMVKVPDHITIYYKRRRAGSPLPFKNADGSKTRQTILSGFPAGLRMVFGANFAADPRPDGMSPRENGRHVGFDLHRNEELIASGSRLWEILELAKPGDKITAIVGGPDLWDGIHADSPNHRAHLAYSYYHAWGWRVAPEGFDYEIPVYTLKAVYSVLEGEDPRDFTFSVDKDMGTDAGELMHGDLFEAWDPQVRQMWLDNALAKGLNCSGGDLGNGLRTRRWPKFSFNQIPQLVPIPDKPSH